jgi:hypothetical protein
MALIGFLNEPTEAVNVKVETETVEDVEVEQVDVVEQAALELERINNELDVEETLQVESQTALEAEYDADVAELNKQLSELKAQYNVENDAVNARLDEIRTIRSSFQ